jgi:uncharacterized surface protein with fasciclin (FAS1) repeats
MSKKYVIILSIFLSLVTIAFSGCIEEEKEKPKNIVETASANDDFETLVTAVVAAGLDGTLSDESADFTVFAPSDDAFAALDPVFLTDLVENDTATLTSILTYHVISSNVMSTDLSDGMRVETVNGKYITIKIEDGNVYVDDAMVSSVDIECSNGVIHVLDAVIVPKDNIVETAIANDDFETLVTAVVAAGLDGTLSDESADFTVFAPTDDAFAALDPVFLTDLVENDTATLTSILTYHVISSNVMSTDLSDGMNVATVEGSTIDITIEDGKVFINDAQVILVDIECSNGVIHVIDQVIVPP